MFAIKTIMTTEVVSLHSGTPIYEALDLLTRHQVSGIPVLNDNDNVIGVLSEKDVLRILVDDHLDVKKTVDDYMSRNVICFKEEDSAIDVCKFFIHSNIRRVPIVRDSKLVGVVSRADIIPLILEAKNKISDFRYV